MSHKILQYKKLRQAAFGLNYKVYRKKQNDVRSTKKKPDPTYLRGNVKGRNYNQVLHTDKYKSSIVSEIYLQLPYSNLLFITQYLGS